MSACAFRHRPVRPDETLCPTPTAPLLDRWPLFAGDQVDEFADFLNAHLSAATADPCSSRSSKGRYRPHKRLLDHVARVIRNEPAFVLLDEQLVAYNAILERVRGAGQNQQSVFLVEGGPGTGKSVIAVNLVAELSADGFATLHLTGSKAFTENLRKIVGRAGALFKYFPPRGAEPQLRT